MKFLALASRAVREDRSARGTGLPHELCPRSALGIDGTRRCSAYLQISCHLLQPGQADVLRVLRERLNLMCRSKAEGGRRCSGRKATMPSAATGSPNYGPPPRPSTAVRRSRANILRHTQKQLRELFDAAVNAAPVDSVPALVSTVAYSYVADKIADAIAARLAAHGCPRKSWQRHLLCGALAAVAQAMADGEETARTAVKNCVAVALVAAGIPSIAADITGRAAADTLMKLTPIRHWEDVRRAVRLLAVSTCPKVADHPEVEQYCLRPLASELLSPAIQAELAESIRDVRSSVI
jgi:hypothetical protein